MSLQSALSSGPGRMLRNGALALAVSAPGLGLAAPAAVAQNASPEIRAKERRDPAAGEVVIINRKDRQGTATKKPAEKKKRAGKTGSSQTATGRSAPDPYAPIELKPLPKDDPRLGRNADNEPASTADNAEPATRRAVTAPRPQPPPVPAARRRPPASISDQARLRAFTPNQLVVPPPPTAVERSSAFRRERAEAEKQLRERAERGRLAARRAEEQSADEVRYRRRPRFRPWRRCRRLAWRCEDGFRRACMRWRRVCT